jgi:CheY-like chemotaxis protein
MSHELRTPLNAVVGLSDLLADEPSGARGREFAGTIRQSAQSLLGVIDRVLDTGRIEAGKLELRPRGFSVRELVRDVYAMFKPEADRRRLAFRFDVDGAVPASVIGDADRLRQVLVNLVDNALKFTEAGAVSIAVTATTRGDGRYLLRFEVADTGIGIKDAQRLRLLRMFSKGESPSTSTDGGMGLGLSISAALVTLMAGEIDYRSEPGRGTKFWFTCAVGLAPPPTVSHEIMLNTAPLAPRVVPRVLLVDDNTVNLLLTRKMLESFGCQVRAAVSGADGLQRLQVESFDVVFMDIRMPGMDGIETTRVWRAHEASGGNRMPIVALTANAMVGDRQACLAAGMDDYLAKPVTLEALRRMVARHFPGAATVQPTH